MAMWGYVWLCSTIYDYVGLCMAMYVYVWLCRAVYSYVGLCRAISSKAEWAIDAETLRARGIIVLVKSN